MFSRLLWIFLVASSISAPGAIQVTYDVDAKLTIGDYCRNWLWSLVHWRERARGAVSRRAAFPDAAESTLLRLLAATPAGGNPDASAYATWRDQNGYAASYSEFLRAAQHLAFLDAAAGLPKETSHDRERGRLRRTLSDLIRRDSADWFLNWEPTFDGTLTFLHVEHGWVRTANVSKISDWETFSPRLRAWLSAYPLVRTVTLHIASYYSGEWIVTRETTLPAHEWRRYFREPGGESLQEFADRQATERRDRDSSPIVSGTI